MLSDIDRRSMDLTPIPRDEMRVPRESFPLNLLDVPTNAAGCPAFPPDVRSRRRVHQRNQRDSVREERKEEGSLRTLLRNKDMTLSLDENSGPKP
jgi:hypothetical protein